MRAIVIDAEHRTVSETDIDGELQSLQDIVGGLITSVYPGLEGTDHHAYVNDEGLLNNPQHFFMLKDGHQPLAGNGVILADDGEGNEAPATLSLDWVKERVTFMDLQAVREWVANEPQQYVIAELTEADIAKLAAERAGTKPEVMTVEAIDENQWAAVELPIPKDATPELLQRAREAAARCVDDTESYLVGGEAESIEDFDASREELDGARRRVAELDGRFAANIGEAEPQRQEERSPALPPDPEMMNDDRAEWAAAALRHFQCSTGTDYDDALRDLLGDLMHWADRNDVDFTGELAIAERHYKAETTAPDVENAENAAREASAKADGPPDDPKAEVSRWGDGLAQNTGQGQKGQKP